MGSIRQVLAAPDDLAGVLVESGDGAILSTGRDDQMVTIQQRALAIAPPRTSSAQIDHHVQMPQGAARGDIMTGDITVAAFNINHLAIDGRRPPRTVAHAVTISTIDPFKISLRQDAVTTGVEFQKVFLEFRSGHNPVATPFP